MKFEEFKRLDSTEIIEKCRANNIDIGEFYVVQFKDGDGYSKELFKLNINEIFTGNAPKYPFDDGGYIKIKISKEIRENSLVSKDGEHYFISRIHFKQDAENPDDFFQLDDSPKIIEEKEHEILSTIFEKQSYLEQITKTLENKESEYENFKREAETEINSYKEDEFGKIDVDIRHFIELYKKLGYTQLKNEKTLRTSIEYSKEDNLSELNEDILYDIKKIIKDNGFEYNDDIIERFYQGLFMNKLIIFSGEPGTGKTSIVKEFANAIGAEHTYISVQSNWTDKQDLFGYYNPNDKTFNGTAFYKALKAAQDAWEGTKGIEESCKWNSPLHIICLDEMNLSKVEYYFSEILSAMERKENNCMTISLYENETIKIHDNVIFVGTLNIDETTSILSPKVLDRSIVIEIDHKQESSTYKDDYNLLIIDDEKRYIPLKYIKDNIIKIEEIDVVDDLKRFNTHDIPVSRRFQKAYKVFKYFGSIKTADDYAIASLLLPTVILSKDDERVKVYENLCSGKKISEPKFTKMKAKEYTVNFW